MICCFPNITSNICITRKKNKKKNKSGWCCAKSKQMDLPEAELLQRHSLDLRQLLLSQLVLEAVAGEEVEADA